VVVVLVLVLQVEEDRSRCSRRASRAEYHQRGMIDSMSHLRTWPAVEISTCLAMLYLPWPCLASRMTDNNVPHPPS
jgi:hypothetical protein